VDEYFKETIVVSGLKGNPTDPDKPVYCEVRYYHTDYVEELKAEIYSLQRQVAMLRKAENDLLRKLAKRR